MALFQMLMLSDKVLLLDYSIDYRKELSSKRTVFEILPWVAVRNVLETHKITQFSQKVKAHQVYTIIQCNASLLCNTLSYSLSRSFRCF